MVAVMSVAGGIESPSTVVTGNPVGQILAGQPFQHAVNGHAIHAATSVYPLLQFLVSQRTICCEQCRKNFDTWRGDPGSGAPYQGFCLLMMQSGRHFAIGT